MKGFLVLAAMFRTTRENIALLVRLDVSSGNLFHIEDEERVELIAEFNQLTM
jgi:hypothetical protein